MTADLVTDPRPVRDNYDSDHGSSYDHSCYLDDLIKWQEREIGRLNARIGENAKRLQVPLASNERTLVLLRMVASHLKNPGLGGLSEDQRAEILDWYEDDMQQRLPVETPAEHDSLRGLLAEAIETLQGWDDDPVDGEPWIVRARRALNGTREPEICRSCGGAPVDSDGNICSECEGAVMVTYTAPEEDSAHVVCRKGDIDA